MIPLIAQLDITFPDYLPVWVQNILFITLVVSPVLSSIVAVVASRENGRLKNENAEILNENAEILNEREKISSYHTTVEKFFEVIVGQNVESSERERRHDHVYERIASAMEKINEAVNEHKTVSSNLISEVGTVKTDMLKARDSMDATHIRIKNLDDVMKDTKRDVATAIEQIKAMILSYQSDVTDAQETSSIAQDKRLQRILEELINFRETMLDQTVQLVALPNIVTPAGSSADNKPVDHKELEKETT